MSLAPSKRAGERAEADQIQRVDGFEAAPKNGDDGQELPYDIVCVRAVWPSPDLPFVGVLVLEQGSEVESKSCAVVINESQDRGRYYLRKKQHEALVELGAFYLFSVRDPNTDEVIAAKIVPATAVTDLNFSWIEAEGRATFGQITWTQIFDREEVESR
ncbi:hypothetical protein C5B91_20255 [Haloferax sp. Atlit-10N]|uniref:hypothetical protein n=1 Tax=unclassified Haloferax TaxID=2625095 RepID=UPI000E261176|nr:MULTISPECIES: hypothetical protein [unclassified Haloferax]RDZ39426.1 hypothetical protein C5B87_19510 [Haloferax sp. Atlit-16N]RDZ53942.1 hypothetical protein C5B91_20255 [Haloferax sp. Atlit-10N]